MNAKQKWIIDGGVFYPVSGNTRVWDSPGSGVFQICEHPFNQGQLGLQKLDDNFKFDFKIYDLGCEDVFTKIYSTWTSSLFKMGRKNLGVIFNGLKGTGKTIAAKLLSNKIGMPVVIVPQAFDNIQSFIQNLNFECTVLIDEAEKTFKSNQECLLKLIDGVYNDYRKLYIMTTNRLSIDENLIGRPGRIRYIKYFGNLTVKAVADYIEDNLIDKNMRNEVLDVVDTLEISTIDILKAVVDEFNIHGCIPDGNMLNIPKANYRFDVMEVCNLPEDKISDFKAFVTERLAKGETINTWLKKVTSEPLPDVPVNDDDDDDDDDESDNKSKKYTNEHLVNKTFGTWIWRTKFSSIFPGLFAEQSTRFGVIKEEPDLHGFFIIQNDGEDKLWCILRGHDAPSLYRGRLDL